MEIETQHIIDIKDLLDRNVKYKIKGGPQSTTESSRQLKRIINSFSDTYSFIYELIQNADDACESDDLKIKISISDNKLIFAHNGNPFSSSDIMALCSTGVERTDLASKSKNHNKIGYKGVGFKSVFKLSDNVQIFTNNIAYQFDKEYWQQNGLDCAKSNGWSVNDINEWDEYCKEFNQINLIEFPWQTMPLVSSINNLPADSEKFKVITVISLIDSYCDNIEKEIQKLFSSSNLLLFLNSSNISIEFGDYLLKKTKTDDSITIESNGELQYWSVYHDSIEADTNLLPLNAPPKMREIDKLNISIAIPVSIEGKIIKLENNTSDVFSFLPTSENYRFPFLVNSQFILDNSREHIEKKDLWNKNIFTNLGKLVAKIIENKVKDTDDFSNIFSLIPNVNEDNDYANELYVSTITSLKTKSFIPVCETEELKKPDEVIIDKTELSKQSVLHSLLFKTLDIKKECYFIDNSQLSEFFSLKHFNIPTITTEKKDLTTKFQKESIKDFLLQQNTKYFESLLLGFKESKVNIDTIKEIPFLLSENDEIKQPGELFLSTEEDELLIVELKINTLKSTLYSDCDYQLKQWIQKKLDINQISPKTIVEKSNSINWSNKEINLKCIRYIFENQDKIDNWEQLKSVKLLSTKGNIQISDELYLSDKYMPKIKIEKVLPDNDIFISDEYCSNNQSFEKWGVFFQYKLKVNYTITASKIISKKASPLSNTFPNAIRKSELTGYLLNEYVSYTDFEYANNLAVINPNLTTRGDYKTKDYLNYFSYICYIEILNSSNKEYSKLFWNAIFDEICQKSNNLRDSIVHRNPNYDWFEKTDFPGLFYLDNLNLWVIRNGSVFPCSFPSINKKASDLILPSTKTSPLKEFLPIVDLEVPKEVTEFEISGNRIFNFRQLPTNDEINQIFSNISNSPNSDKYDITLIYKALFEIVIEMEDFQLDESTSLLTVDNEFEEIAKIVFIADESLRTKLKHTNHLYIPNSFSKEQVKKLVDILKIQPVTFDISTKGSISTGFLYFLKEKIPLLKIIFNTKFSEQLLDFKVVIHDEIQVFISSEGFQLSAYYCEDTKTFNILKNWKTNRKTQREISEEISKLLGVNLLTLDDTIWREIHSIINELETEGIQVPENIKQELIQKELSNSETPITKDISSEPGILSEKKVFRKLVQTYLNGNGNNELSNSSSIQNSEYHFKNEHISIIWTRGSNKYENHDIKVELSKNGKIQNKYIEVKSTGNSKFHREGESLYFSDQEWDKLYNPANENDTYHLAIVYNNRNPELEENDLHLVRIIPEKEIKNVLDE